MKRFFAVALVVAESFAVGQTIPTKPDLTFRGHRIGETAQEFFAKARMAEKGGLSIDYCKVYLSDPKVQKAWEKAQRNKFDVNAVIASSDAAGCNDINAALAGQDTEVGFRFASEFGPGSAQFSGGKLALISFTVTAAFDDVVTDMKNKLGAVPLMGEDVLQNAFGAKLIQRKATWATGQIAAVISESRSFRYGNMGTIIVIADSSAMAKMEKKREASRPNTLD